MPAANVIQLRQLLKEKMPQLRLSLDELPSHRRNQWLTGISQIDEPLHGGLPKGALTEISAPTGSTGSALLRNALLTHAAREKQIAGFIDGSDSFDLASVDHTALDRLLWVRCHSAEEAMKTADLLLRDRNVPFVILDLMGNPATQLRRIPATAWFRFQRILEPGSTLCLAFTPWLMVHPARVRISLSQAQFSLNALESEPEELLTRLELEVSDTRRARESDEALHTLA